MICVVLAAGYATRLYPLTENFPKPLLSVGEKNILDWLLDDIDLSRAISRYVVVSNHKFFSQFVSWSRQKKLSVPVTILDDGSVTNESRLGAVKDILFAVDELKLQDDLLVLAGDNVLDFGMKGFITYGQEKNSPCVMRYFEESKEKLMRTGVAEIDEEDRIVHMEEKPGNPKANWALPPFYYYPKNGLHFLKDAVSAGCNTDAPGSVIVWLCRQTSVFAMEMPGKRYDIGNLQSYEEVKKHYNGII